MKMTVRKSPDLMLMILSIQNGLFKMRQEEMKPVSPANDIANSKSPEHVLHMKRIMFSV